MELNKKRGLGRGLETLLGPSDKTTTSKTSSTKEEVAIPKNQRLWSVPIEKIAPHKNQPRKTFEKSKLKELAASIKEYGILQPIVAKKTSENRWTIVAGERRWRAAQLAGLQQVPVITKDVDAQKHLELALLENIQREDLNPIEEAKAYEDLIENYHLTQTELGEQLGKDRATISNTLRLLQLSEGIQKEVMGGSLSLGHAKVLLSVNKKDQMFWCKKVLKEKLSVRALEKKIRATNTSPAKKAKASSTEETHLKSLEDALRKKWGTKTKLSYSRGKGHVTFHFFSADEFEGLIEKLTK